MRKFKEPFGAIIKRDRHLERMVTQRVQQLVARRTRAKQALEGLRSAMQALNIDCDPHVEPSRQITIRPYVARLNEKKQQLTSQLLALDEEIDRERQRLKEIRGRLAQFEELRSMRYAAWRVDQLREQEANRQELVLRKLGRPDTTGGETE